ncbi:MAG TPA: helix-turn-helix transcriptional regulator [Rhizomicrobium sp.]|nr:helix-turn-helix transcriptional regulator [Rhizomicrobium sp.]
MPARTDLQVRHYPAFHAMAPHRHDAPSMNIVLGGGFIERIGKSERHYQRGHVAFFPAGATHSQRFGAAPTRQIVFRPQRDWLASFGDSAATLAGAPHLRDISFCYLGERLLREIRARDTYSDLVCEGVLLEIVAAFGRSCETGRRQSTTPPQWLRRVREFLHEQSGASLRMTDVAKTAARHEVHVAREFRRFYGTTIGDYLRKLRLDSAAQQLSDPRAEICQVALDCGFSSHSHLCREFKRRFGVTPSHFRARR